jgi:acetyl-CoA carboxylase biotin carboxyl carrier protein
LSEKRNKKKSAAHPAAAPSISNSGPMDLGLLAQLVKLMADNGLSTMELSEGNKRITLKRGGESVAVPQSMTYGYAPPPAGSAAVPRPASGAAGEASAANEADSKLIPIKSPMVGTFYAAPAKGAKPYVTVGSTVDETTDVCIIEAMKNFNVHKAECRGTIAKILIQDGEPVDFGQALFLVSPG